MLSALGAAVLLAACNTPVNRAPVESRGTAAAAGAEPVAVDAAPASAPQQPPLPGAENAGKPGYYTVKPGDTLIGISLDHGQTWKDLARWNQLENPNLIKVGQVLRVTPPDAASTAAVVASDQGVVTRPVTSGSAAPAAAPVAATPPAETPAAPVAASGDLRLVWPASGKVEARFDSTRNKGIDIDGKAGDAVLAAADGRVVYAGAGLRGYGNLLIVQHNKTYLTAYAHNQKLLVKEDQSVRGGQKIAEMGSTDSDHVKLHFEVRREGKPVDPLRYLPAR